MSEQIVLNLLTEVRDDLKKYVAKTEQHATQLKDILGNGQPGRLAEVEALARDLDQWKWKLIGICVGLVLLMEGAHTGLTKLLELVH